MTGKHFFTAAILAVVLAGMAVPAAAAPQTPDKQDNEDDNPAININLDEVVDTLDELVDTVSDLADNLKDMIINAAVTALFKPFQILAQTLSDIITHVIISYPDVTSDDVLELHSLVFRLSLLLAVAGFTVIGVGHVVNRFHGIKPSVYLLAGLTVGGVAPWLLSYLVRLSHLAAVTLRPENPGIAAVSQLTLGTVLVAVVEAVLLLGVILLYVIRDVYLMFYVAASPLIFLGFAVPHLKRFSRMLTGVFTAFLLIGPLDLIVYRLTLSLLEVRGGEAPHWIWAVGGLTLMLTLPFYTVRAGSQFMEPAARTARSAVEQVKPVAKNRYSEWREGKPGVEVYKQRAKNRFLSNKPARVETRQRPGNDLELRNTTTRARKAGNRLKNLVRNSETGIEVEENWQQDEQGDWTKEAELEEE